MGWRARSQRFQHGAKASRQWIEAGRERVAAEFELPGENFNLLIERRTPQAGEPGIVRPGPFEDPTGESDFSHRGARVGFQLRAKKRLPIRRTVAAVPRMEPIPRQDPPVFLGQGGDDRPVLFTGAPLTTARRSPIACKARSTSARLEASQSS